MSVVVDANLVAAVILPLPYRPQARAKVLAWNQAGEELTSPTLMEYEVCSTIRRVTLAGWVTADEAREALAQMRRLGIQAVPPTVELHRAALEWAHRLQRSRTYDAQYMALAEELRADLWTCDLALFHKARQLGIAWVHSVLAPSAPPA